MASNNNAEAKLAEELKQLQEQQNKQAELVRDLKKSGPKEKFEAELEKLKQIKTLVEAKVIITLVIYNTYMTVHYR
jgi:hypothetical protein